MTHSWIYFYHKLYFIMLNSNSENSYCVYKTQGNLNFFFTLDFSNFVCAIHILWFIEGSFQNWLPVTKIKAPVFLLKQLGVEIVPSVKESVSPHYKKRKNKKPLTLNVPIYALFNRQPVMPCRWAQDNSQTSVEDNRKIHSSTVNFDQVFLAFTCDKYEFVLAKSPQNDSWSTTSYFEKAHVVFIRKYLWEKKKTFSQHSTQECF